LIGESLFHITLRMGRDVAQIWFELASGWTDVSGRSNDAGGTGAYSGKGLGIRWERPLTLVLALWSVRVVAVEWLSFMKNKLGKAIPEGMA